MALWYITPGSTISRYTDSGTPIATPALTAPDPSSGSDLAGAFFRNNALYYFMSRRSGRNDSFIDRYKYLLTDENQFVQDSFYGFRYFSRTLMRPGWTHLQGSALVVRRGTSSVLDYWADAFSDSNQLTSMLNYPNGIGPANMVADPPINWNHMVGMAVSSTHWFFAVANTLSPLVGDIRAFTRNGVTLTEDVSKRIRLPAGYSLVNPYNSQDNSFRMAVSGSNLLCSIIDPTETTASPTPFKRNLISVPIPA